MRLERDDMNTMNFPQQTQCGAVLVISLVLLAVLTLAGVASMSGSTLELRASSNAQQFQRVYEAALSRIEFATSEDPDNPLDYLQFIQDVDDPASWVAQTCNSADGCADGADWTATAEMRFTGGCRTMPGFSLESGKAPVMRTFEITVNASNAAGNTRSTQVQGVRHPAAAC